MHNSSICVPKFPKCTANLISVFIIIMCKIVILTGLNRIDFRHRNTLIEQSITLIEQPETWKYPNKTVSFCEHGILAWFLGTCVQADSVYHDIAQWPKLYTSREVRKLEYTKQLLYCTFSVVSSFHNIGFISRQWHSRQQQEELFSCVY